MILSRYALFSLPKVVSSTELCETLCLLQPTFLRLSSSTSLVLNLLPLRVYSIGEWSSFDATLVDLETMLLTEAHGRNQV